ncbi:hypothetical protein V1511DRAFT_513770 [Dipodascopsis uninucleata]
MSSNDQDADKFNPRATQPIIPSRPISRDGGSVPVIPRRPQMKSRGGSSSSEVSNTTSVPVDKSISDTQTLNEESVGSAITDVRDDGDKEPSMPMPIPTIRRRPNSPSVNLREPRTEFEMEQQLAEIEMDVSRTMAETAKSERFTSPANLHNTGSYDGMDHIQALIDIHEHTSPEDFLSSDDLDNDKLDPEPAHDHIAQDTPQVPRRPQSRSATDSHGEGPIVPERPRGPHTSSASRSQSTVPSPENISRVSTPKIPERPKPKSIKSAIELQQEGAALSYNKNDFAVMQVENSSSAESSGGNDVSDLEDSKPKLPEKHDSVLNIAAMKAKSDLEDLSHAKTDPTIITIERTGAVVPTGVVEPITTPNISSSNTSVNSPTPETAEADENGDLFEIIDSYNGAKDDENLEPMKSAEGQIVNAKLIESSSSISEAAESTSKVDSVHEVKLPFKKSPSPEIAREQNASPPVETSTNEISSETELKSEPKTESKSESAVPEVPKRPAKPVVPKRPSKPLAVTTAATSSATNITDATESQTTPKDSVPLVKAKPPPPARPNKLSGLRAAFAKDLESRLGKSGGIPIIMPRPHKTETMSSPETVVAKQSTEERPESDVQEQKSISKKLEDPRRARTRGPRGRKLPAPVELPDPVRISRIITVWELGYDIALASDSTPEECDKEIEKNDEQSTKSPTVSDLQNTIKDDFNNNADNKYDEIEENKELSETIITQNIPKQEDLSENITEGAEVLAILESEDNEKYDKSKDTLYNMNSTSPKREEEIVSQSDEKFKEASVKESNLDKDKESSEVVDEIARESTGDESKDNDDESSKNL